MKKHIPNTLTLMNLLSGCFGVVFSFSSDLRMVSLMILISLFLDYLDGMSARILDVKSEIGKELDSLADLVSFGLLPGLLAYHLLLANSVRSWAFVAFLIPVFSAYRLANFNIDKRQTVNFIGLPTPANAIFWGSFPLIIFHTGNSVLGDFLAEILSDKTALFISIALTSYLLNADMLLFSLKFKSMKWEDNKVRYLFLIGSAILFGAFYIHAIPFIIILYIILSILFHKQVKSYEIQS